MAKEKPVSLMGIDSGGEDYNGTHIQFRMRAPTPGRKTQIWTVQSKGDNCELGEVRWFARWRKYSFFPAPKCVFEDLCMREISQFIVDRTHEHKHGL